MQTLNRVYLFGYFLAREFRGANLVSPADFESFKAQAKDIIEAGNDEEVEALLSGGYDANNNVPVFFSRATKTGQDTNAQPSEGLPRAFETPRTFDGTAKSSDVDNSKRVESYTESGLAFDSGATPDGLFVFAVMDGSRAQRAGLQRGDAIVRIGKIGCRKMVLMGLKSCQEALDVSETSIDFVRGGQAHKNIQVS